MLSGNSSGFSSSGSSFFAQACQGEAVLLVIQKHRDAYMMRGFILSASASPLKNPKRCVHQISKKTLCTFTEPFMETLNPTPLNRPLMEALLPVSSEFQSAELRRVVYRV